MLWTCTRCGRVFRQAGQTHSCGVGSRDALLAGKDEALARLFESLEKSVRRWPGVEIVYRDRYVLFRTTRIFADLVFMKDALRLAILLDRQVRSDRRFFKVGRLSSRRVGHVTKLRSREDLRGTLPYLKEAYRFALSDGAGSRRTSPSKRR